MDEPIRFYDSEGDIVARDNLLLAFFGKCPFAQIVGDAKHLFDRWLALIPDDVLKWVAIGEHAEYFKALNPQGLARCHSMLNEKVAKEKNIVFDLKGPQRSGPDYRFVVSGYKEPAERGFLDQTNLVEMTFPGEFLAAYGLDNFVDLAFELFGHIRCDSGYSSPALTFGADALKSEAGEYIAPRGLRHHGYDIPSNFSTKSSMGAKSRGARWLTMLSQKLVDQLDDKNALRKKLVEGVDVRESANGVMLRAGREPEIGDTNRKKLTPLLNSVAHAIEDVTYFHDNSLLPLFDDDPEKRDRWERRFWQEE
jgi:hypothetical protein